MRRFTRFLFRLMVGFIGLSLALVLLFKFVPVPITATMIMNGDGITKDWEPLSDIDRNMVRAVIAAEDGKYCSHDGFDREAIEEAIEENAKGGRIRGGSTISQQTVKNLFLWQGRSWLRKSLEAVWTPVAEAVWPKRRILELYLNEIEFGEGVFGVEAAARHYFGVSAADLSDTQAARLAMVLPDPKDRDAANPTDTQRRRTRSIMDGAATIAADGRAACFQS